MNHNFVPNENQKMHQATTGYGEGIDECVDGCGILSKQKQQQEQGLQSQGVIETRQEQSNNIEKQNYRYHHFNHHDNSNNNSHNSMNRKRRHPQRYQQLPHQQYEDSDDEEDTSYRPGDIRKGREKTRRYHNPSYNSSQQTQGATSQPAAPGAFRVDSSGSIHILDKKLSGSNPTSSATSWRQNDHNDYNSWREKRRRADNRSSDSSSTSSDTEIPLPSVCHEDEEHSETEAETHLEDDEEFMLHNQGKHSMKMKNRQQPPEEAGLVRATMIVGDDSKDEFHTPIVTAERDSMKAFLKRSRCAQISMFVGCFVVIGLVVGVTLTIFNSSILSTGNEETAQPQFFSQVGSSLDGNEIEGRFGKSISLNGDGTLMAVADIENIFIYTLVAGEGGQGGESFFDWELSAVIESPPGATSAAQYSYSEQHNIILSASNVELSRAGNAVAIGWPFSTNEEGLEPGTGCVQIYHNKGDGRWTRLGNTMYGSSKGDNFGSSVAISETGQIIAVGSSGISNGVVNKANVFRLNDLGKWEKHGDLIELDDALAVGSVSISETGQTLAIGGCPYTGKNSVTSTTANVVAVRIFYFIAGFWIELGDGISGNFDDTAYIAVLSGDGSIVAVSNYYTGESRATQGGLNDALDVRVFEWNNDDKVWVQLGDNLHAYAPGDKSGYFISLSDDGKLIGMGDPGRRSEGGGGVAGHVHMFQYKEDLQQWEQIGPNRDGDAPGDQFGFAVALSGNGEYFAAAAPFNRGEGIELGRVYVFRIDI